jgi:ATP-dependent Clp protease, protease subunit
VEIHAREIMDQKRRVNEILAERTGQEYEKIERDTDRDYILSSKDAVSYGVIDRVVDRPEGRVTATGR